MYAKLRCGGNLPLCERTRYQKQASMYGICVPCSKRLPGVRDAFSDAFGVKNRLFRYGRDIRCQKQPSLVRDASQRPAEQPTPQTVDSLLPHRTHLQCAKRPPLGGEQT